MKKLLISFTYCLSIFLGLTLLVTPIYASSNSSSSDEVGASILGFYFTFVFIYYCFICLYFLAICVHAVLCVISILDIAKRPNTALNKDTWILGIILPSVIPILNYIGIFVSVSIELYYLLSYRNQLEESTNNKAAMTN